MFRSTNVPFDQCSVRPMFHLTNVPSTKVHSTKVFSTKVSYPLKTTFFLALVEVITHHGHSNKGKDDRHVGGGHHQAADIRVVVQQVPQPWEVRPNHQCGWRHLHLWSAQGSFNYKSLVIVVSCKLFFWIYGWSLGSHGTLCCIPQECWSVQSEQTGKQITKNNKSLL